MFRLVAVLWSLLCLGSAIAHAQTLSARDIHLMLIWTGDLNAEAGRVPEDEFRQAVAAFRKRIGSSGTGPLTAGEIDTLKRQSGSERAKSGVEVTEDGATGVRLELPQKLLTAERTSKGDRSEWRTADGELLVKTFRLTGPDSDIGSFYASVKALKNRKLVWPPAGAEITATTKAVTIEGLYDEPRHPQRTFHIRARREGGETRALQFSYPTARKGRFQRVANAMLSTFEPFPAAVPIAAPHVAPPTSVAGVSQKQETSPQLQLKEFRKEQLSEKRQDIDSGRVRPGKRVALVIGNSGYRFGKTLPNPRNDATDMAQVLQPLGFEVVAGLDLDKRALERKVQDFRRSLQGADVGLFYYAGHGLQIGGRNLIVPVDAEIEQEPDADLNTVSLDTIINQMSSSAPLNLVFLDACRDNPFSARLATSVTRSLTQRPVEIQRGFTVVQSGVGTFIAFATAPDKVASDGQGGRNSPFTAALIKHLPVRDQSVDDLMSAVRSDVIRATDGRQIPWHSSALTGRFVFAASTTAAR